MQGALLLVLSLMAFGYVLGTPTELLQTRATSDNSFFTMILDALKSIEDDVAKVSSELETNGNQVEDQLTQLTASIEGSKTDILSNLIDIDRDIGNAQTGLDQSIGGVDTKVCVFISDL